MSNFQVRYNYTRINTAPVKSNPRSHFGIVILDEDANDTVLKFLLRGIDLGVPIKNFSDEDLDTLLVY